MSHPTSLKPRTILVVDDNQVFADNLCLSLQFEGYECRAAYGGEAALAVFVNFEPDVVVLDLDMPKMSGHQVAKAIRQSPLGHKILLIAITGWAREIDRLANDTAFDFHLPKPFKLQALVQLLWDEGTDAIRCRDRFII